MKKTVDTTGRIHTLKTDDKNAYVRYLHYTSWIIDIEFLYVEKPYRKKGYPHQLFEHLFEKFPNHTFVLVATDDGSGKLIRFYQQFGFQVDLRRLRGHVTMVKRV